MYQEFTGNILGIFGKEAPKVHKIYQNLPPHYSLSLRLNLVLYADVSKESDFVMITLDSFQSNKYTKEPFEGDSEQYYCSNNKKLIGFLTYYKDKFINY